MQNEPDSAAITAAKQQLDQMKSASVAAGAGLDPKLAPQLPVTQLNPTSDYPAPAPIKQKIDALRRRSSENWLVDGVMRPDAKDRQTQGRRDSRGESSDGHRLGNATEAFDEESDARDSLDPADSLRVEGDLTDGATPANSARATSAAVDGDRLPRPTDADPLAKYLSDWLSPQDVSLLKNTAVAPGDALPSPGDPISSTSLPADSGAGSGGIDAFAEHAAGGEAKPVDNPFLQFLKSSDAAMAPLPVPPPVESAPSITPPPTEMPEPGTKSTVPDFARPAFDDKYYKPLKRF